jgi:hypothetical protein
MPKYTVEGNMKDPEGVIRRRTIHNLGGMENEAKKESATILGLYEWPYGRFLLRQLGC